MYRRGPMRAMPIGAELQQDGGVHFRIWAPLPKSIMLIVDGDEHAMQTEEAGYRSAYVATARAGSRYGYRVDRSERILPDPASRVQPEGPHAPSVVADPSAYRWTDAAWPGVRRDGQVIYEMHVGTFTREGTWTAAIDKLPLLKEVGISVIEMMPVAEFPGRFGWGYDGVSRWGCCHPHPSQSRTRRFPASGSSRERFARDGVVAMDDPRRRKRMSLQESVEAVPGEHALTIPTGQPFLPDPHDFMGVPP